LTGHTRKPSKRWRLKANCPEGAILGRHFKKVIADIVGNSWLHYGDSTTVANWKSLPPARKCTSKESSDPMARISFAGKPSDVFDAHSVHVEKLVNHPTGRPPGDAERHIWGLAALEWKQEEAALEQAEDAHEDDSGERTDIDEEYDDEDAVSFMVRNAVDMDDERDEYVYYV
jgi:hypothetical protein